MRLQVKATGFDLTPALNQLIEQKFSGLTKLLERWEKNTDVLLRVEVAKNTKHHNKGKVFYAEANLDLPMKILRIEETAEDMHEAVDKLKDRLKKEISRYKEKLADH